MRYFLILFIAVFFNFSYAQNQFNQLGFEVHNNDLITNSFPKDSSATAIVLYEQGNSYVNESFKLITKIKRKIKILNREGFDKATIEVFLYNSDRRREKIKAIKGVSFNYENDKIVKTKLDQDNIYKNKLDDHYTSVKFAMPNIKEGSVFTYTYTIESPFFYKYHSWDFQSDIPKIYSEYNASIPGNWEYHIKLMGDLELDTNDSKIKKNCLEGGYQTYANCLDTKYIMKNIPAFIEEDYFTSKKNYLSRIEYELKVFRDFKGNVDKITKDWKSADSEIKTHSNLGKQFFKKSPIKKLLANTNHDGSSLDIARSIYDYVQENYSWNKKNKIFSGNNVKKLIEEKSGNVSSINTLLLNLLHLNNIKARPVLLSTRNNGFATKLYPAISEFNYLLVQIDIDNKQYFLDATDPYLAFGQLPFRCLNQYGRLLDFNEGSSWVDIQPSKNSLVSYYNKLHLNSDGILKGDVLLNTKGYHALSMKKSYLKNKEDYIDTIDDQLIDVTVSEFELLEGDKNSEEFNGEYKVAFNKEAINNTLYINPVFVSFFKENPFKLQERTYPIDFGYKDSYLYRASIALDNKYSIKELPENKTVYLPNNKGSLIFMTQKKGNSIEVYLKMSFNQALYDKSYYNNLKQLFNTFIDIQNNSIIVVSAN